MQLLPVYGELLYRLSCTEQRRLPFYFRLSQQLPYPPCPSSQCHGTQPNVCCSEFCSVVFQRNGFLSIYCEGLLCFAYRDINVELYDDYFNSSVDITTGYGLDGRGVAVRVPVRARVFFFPRRPDRFWGTASFLSSGYREYSFPRGKAARA
jgi:hypothetical protein